MIKQIPTPDPSNIENKPNKPRMNKKKILSFTAILTFILFSVGVFWFVGQPMLRLVADPEGLRSWVYTHGIWGRLVVIGMMSLQIVVALIPGEPIEIGAGYAYGVWEGTLLCLSGAVLGSALVFLFVRHFGIKAVEVFFPQEKIRSLRFLQNARQLNFLVFILFFIPGTPKGLLSYFIALTPIKMSTWLLITSFARIPSVITSTMGGNALGMQNYQFALLVFLLTLLVSGAGILVYRRISTAKNGLKRRAQRKVPRAASAANADSQANSASLPNRRFKKKGPLKNKLSP